MIIGIDSYHDKKRKQVSVAAFVATTNPQCTSYYSRIVMQTKIQELVDGISVCIRSKFNRLNSVSVIYVTWIFRCNKSTFYAK
jgi:hypothetical protein